MACEKGCNCSSCTPSVVSCEKPITLGVEDINFGCGTEDQIRGCKVTITQVNSKHIIYCESGKPVEAYIDDLRRMFPYIECDIGRPTMDYAIWADAQITSDVDSCAIGLPDELVQRIPFQEGDVALHNGCLWISLVNDNLTEPSAATMLDGQWLCLSTIDSRFREIIDRLVLLEACVFPDGEPSLCETVANLTDIALESATRNVDNSITLTLNDGNTIVVPPAGLVDRLFGGAFDISKSIDGTFTIPNDSNIDIPFTIPKSDPDKRARGLDIGTHVFDKTAYPILQTTGVEINISLIASSHIVIDRPVTGGTAHNIQADLYLKVNNTLSTVGQGDMYVISDGIHSHISNSRMFTYTTANEDLSITGLLGVVFEHAVLGDASAEALVDYARMAVTFTEL